MASTKETKKSNANHVRAVKAAKTAKINRAKEIEDKNVKLLALNGLLQALLISIVAYIMLGPCNETIVAILDTIKGQSISAWQVAIVVFPIVFVCCTLIEIASYAVRREK